MRKSFIIISIIFALLAAIYFGRNLIIKTSVSAGVKAMTGLKLSVRSMNIGILNSLIGINGLELFNPPGFIDKLMVDLPEVYVDYNLGAFIKRKVHLEEVRLDLKEFAVIKNEKGELNLDSLRVVEEKKEKKTEDEEEKTEMPEIQIDVLELKIGKVVYKDYSKGTPAKLKEFNVNIDERYENITDPRALISLIVVKALKNTTIASLTNFNLGALQENVAGKLKDTTRKVVETADKVIETGKEDVEKKVKEASEKATEAGKDVGEKVKETAGETIEKATDAIKKVLPFGK
jgi:ElaB/YqjD/DUF883 family membrane-anchored ribosome-binding protein